MLSPRFVGGAAEDLQIRRNILRGDKEMKKMNKPEVEAIRFDSNDVIATSGAGTFIDSGNYVTRGSELIEQYGTHSIGSTSVDSGSFYQFTLNSGNVSIDSITYSATGITDTYGHYAWYNNNDSYKYWGTDEKYADQYGGVSKLPTGID